MVLHRNLILVETLIFFYPIPIYPLGAFVLTLRQYFFMHLYSYMVAGLKEFANLSQNSCVALSKLSDRKRDKL